MANLERLRRRLPLIVFLLLAIVVVMLLGIACACLTDDPMQALERALAVGAGPPALPDRSMNLLGALLAVSMLASVAASSRASPAVLQRFRF